MKLFLNFWFIQTMLILIFPKTNLWGKIKKFLSGFRNCKFSQWPHGNTCWTAAGKQGTGGQNLGRRPEVRMKLMAFISPKGLATLNSRVLCRVALHPWTGACVEEVAFRGGLVLTPQKEELVN